MEDILYGTSQAIPSISISPISNSSSFVAIFPVGDKQHSVGVTVLDNGGIDVDVAPHLKERAAGLIENAGIEVGMEFLMKQLAIE